VENLGFTVHHIPKMKESMVVVRARQWPELALATVAMVASRAALATVAGRGLPWWLVGSASNAFFSSSDCSCK